MGAGEVNLVGTTIGAYRIVSRLGVGGMGAVYRAEQAPLGRPVALKVIHDRLAQDPGVAARFLREAKIASSLRNPNTVTLYDFGQATDGRLYMAMELLEGEGLSTRLRRVGPFAPPEAVTIGLQICRSLSEAHAKGIVHRDLKSENVFMTTGDDGELLVKVLDYGIAHAGVAAAPIAASALDAPVPAALTEHGMVVGTPSYMSPEQARGEPVDGRSDLFSLGIILFELLTGVCPFRGDNAIIILGKLLTEPPPAMGAVGNRRSPPAALEGLVRMLLAKDREDRPATALVVQTRLRASVGSGVVGPAVTTSLVRELDGHWGLPSALLPPGQTSQEQATVTVSAATPVASAAVPAEHTDLELHLPIPSRPPAPPPAPQPVMPTPPLPAPPPAVATPSPASLELDLSPRHLEIDRQTRAELDVAHAQRRPSLPARPQASRALPPASTSVTTWVVAIGVIAAAASAAWLIFVRPGQTAPEAPIDGGVTVAAPAPVPEPSGPVAVSVMALSRAQEALRAQGFAPVALPPGEWTGSYELDGGTLRVFEEGERVTAIFESALRSGSVQGRLAADGVLEFDWRSTDTGAVRGAQVRTGRGTLRPWTGPGGKRLLGTWGFGESRDGGIWLAVPRGAAGATTQRRGR